MPEGEADQLVEEGSTHNPEEGQGSEAAAEQNSGEQFVPISRTDRFRFDSEDVNATTEVDKDGNHETTVEEADRIITITRGKDSARPTFITRRLPGIQEDKLADMPGAPVESAVVEDPDKTDEIDTREVVGISRADAVRLSLGREPKGQTRVRVQLNKGKK